MWIQPVSLSQICRIYCRSFFVKKGFIAFLISASLVSAEAASVCASDEFFEEYSKEVSDQIAKQGDSAEDFFQGQEMQEGEAASSGEEDGEAETEGEQARVDEENSDQEGRLKITSFHGYDWGTSDAVIRKAEISQDMENKLDYSLLAIDESGNTIRDRKTEKAAEEGSDSTSGSASDDIGIKSLGVKGYSIGGYDATSFYVFEKGKLTGGVYEFFMDGDAYLDLVSQCTIAYGKPVLSEENSEEYSQGTCSLWKDAEGNYIFAALSLGIIYAQHGSAITGVFEDGIEGACGIDLEEELEKKG